MQTHDNETALPDAVCLVHLHKRRLADTFSTRRLSLALTLFPSWRRGALPGRIGRSAGWRALSDSGSGSGITATELWPKRWRAGLPDTSFAGCADRSIKGDRPFWVALLELGVGAVVVAVERPQDQLSTGRGPRAVRLPDVVVLAGLAVVGQRAAPCRNGSSTLSTGAPESQAIFWDAGYPRIRIPSPLSPLSENFTGTALPAFIWFSVGGLSTGEKKPENA
jgi:hypothetical protein